MLAFPFPVLEEDNFQLELLFGGPELHRAAYASEVRNRTRIPGAQQLQLHAFWFMIFRLSFCLNHQSFFSMFFPSFPCCNELIEGQANRESKPRGSPVAPDKPMIVFCSAIQVAQDREMMLQPLGDWAGQKEYL